MFFMFFVILKVTNSSFLKGMTFCHSIYVKKVMKLFAFIFEQPLTIVKSESFLIGIWGGINDPCCMWSKIQ